MYVQDLAAGVVAELTEFLHSKWYLSQNPSVYTVYTVTNRLMEWPAENFQPSISIKM